LIKNPELSYPGPVTATDLRAETRAYGRSRLRALALDAARQVVLDRGWAAVRMGAVAAAVGVSRQSLHAEFGTKDDLGQALVLREASAFFAELRERLAAHPRDLAAGVADAAGFILSATRDNPMLQTILTRTPANGGDVALLPLLTTRGEALFEQAGGILGEWVGAQWPEADPADVALTVDTVVRLGISYILTPTKPDAEIAALLAAVACRCLRLTDPGPQRT
jgi:AcrR family transcriptional regulator